MTDINNKICSYLYKDCLLKICHTFKNCILKFNDFDENKTTFLSKWIYKNVILYVKVKVKSARKTKKVC